MYWSLNKISVYGDRVHGEAVHVFTCVAFVDPLFSFLLVTFKIADRIVGQRRRRSRRLCDSGATARRRPRSSGQEVGRKARQQTVCSSSLARDAPSSADDDD